MMTKVNRTPIATVVKVKCVKLICGDQSQVPGSVAQCVFVTATIFGSKDEAHIEVMFDCLNDLDRRCAAQAVCLPLPSCHDPYAAGHNIFCKPLEQDILFNAIVRGIKSIFVFKPLFSRAAFA